MSTLWARANARPAGAEVNITGEYHKVPLASPFVVMLREVPKQSAGVTCAGFTETTGVPGAGQFRVYYETGTTVQAHPPGAVEFHSSAAGQIVGPFVYSGTGSPQHVGDLAEVSRAIETLGIETGQDFVVRGLDVFWPIHRIPARSAKMSTSGTWSSTTLAANTDEGQVVYISDTAGAYIEHTFIGTGCRVIYRKVNSYGIADVTIDGSPPLMNPTIDMYASAPITLNAVEYTGLTYGSHTIRLTRSGNKNSSSSGTAINLDAIDVLTYGEDFRRIVVAASTKTIRANDSDVTQVGTWTATATGFDVFPMQMQATGAATLSHTFEGTGVVVWLRRGTDCGLADITIDGNTAASFDCYSATAQDQIPVCILGLANGSHSVVISATGTKSTPASSTAVRVLGFSVLQEEANPEPFEGTQDGVAYVRGARISRLTGTTVQLDATDSENPRYDLAYVNAQGNIGTVLGTAAASPVVPVWPANSVPLAALYREKTGYAPKTLYDLCADRRPISHHHITIYDTPGTYEYVVPDVGRPLTQLLISGCGGGGNGSASSGDSAGMGGGAGAYCIRQPLCLPPRTQIVVTVGGIGQATSFGSYISLAGGTTTGGYSGVEIYISESSYRYNLGGNGRGGPFGSPGAGSSSGAGGAASGFGCGGGGAGGTSAGGAGGAGTPGLMIIEAI